MWIVRKPLWHKDSDSPCVPFLDLVIKYLACSVFLQGTLPSVWPAFSSHCASASRCCAPRKIVDSSVAWKAGAVKMFDAAMASAKLFAFGLFAEFVVAAAVAE